MGLFHVRKITVAGSEVNPGIGSSTQQTRCFMLAPALWLESISYRKVVSHGSEGSDLGFADVGVCGGVSVQTACSKYSLTLVWVSLSRLPVANAR